jgi:aminoglycoside phosphotransferase (APT) family kinase protein
MHPDELDIDPVLVGQLLAAQFPEWGDLPLEPVPSAGTDNALYRLGDAMVVRLPRIHWAVEQVAKEQEWLPRLAPFLPLPIPALLARGTPTDDYPWKWSIYSWLDGESVATVPLADPRRAAGELAAFITALQRIAATDGPGARRAQRLAR